MDRSAHGDFPGFSVLMVCTGNICRSPVAEKLMSLAMGPSVTITSAGTCGLSGARLSASMRSLLGDGDDWAGAFRARRLTEGLVRNADLVLGMSREHRAAAVQLWPAAVRRTFTLGEYSRLVSKVGRDGLPVGPLAERMRASVPLAAAQRHHVGVRLDIDDDIPDPYRRSEEEFGRAFDQIHLAVQTVGAVLVGDPVLRGD